MLFCTPYLPGFQGRG